MSRPIPILLYHAVSEQASARFRRWAVAPERFAAQMEHLAEAGYSSLTVARLAECRAGEKPLPPKPVVVTFDDGYADFTTAALPVLRRFGLTCTLFISAGYVGGTSEWLVREGETSRPMLTWSSLEQAASPDVEMAAHGFSHRQLDTLPFDEAFADVQRGVAMVEDRLGAVRTFAYPHGYSTARLRAALPDLGLSAACGVVDRLSRETDNPFDLARIIVPGDLHDERFPALLAGDEERPPPRASKRLLWRWMRRSRLAVGLDRAHVPT